MLQPFGNTHLAVAPNSHSFGLFELSLAERSLRSNGLALTLGSRASDLLVALVERRGRAVSKDELLDAAWGKVVVEERELHVHVSRCSCR